METLKKLVWDSELFGYNVGKLEVTEGTVIKWEELNDFKLTYIFGKLNDLQLNRNNIVPVDEKVVLEKFLDKSIPRISHEVIPFNGGNHSYQELIELAFSAGIYSRFYIDGHFKNNEFNKLYTTWTNNSIKEPTTIILISLEGDKINGFITIESRNNFAEIGLLAVSSENRGKGIGSALIQKGFFLSSSKYSSIRVSTQKANSDALRLYKKNGFKIKTITPIYHYWNL